MKKCPYCAESIQDDAVKCRFCHEFLGGGIRSPRKRNLFLLIMFGGPFALFEVWRRKDLPKEKKYLITVIVLALFFSFVFLAIYLFFQVYALYNSVFQQIGNIRY